MNFAGTMPEPRSLNPRRLAALGLVVAGLLAAQPAAAGALTLAGVNGAEFSKSKKKSRESLIKAQVLLDRAGFSLGVIDGRRGGNFTNALRAFQEQNELRPTGELDRETFVALGEVSPEPPLMDYVITADDVRGPFVEQIPDDYEQKAALKRLGYTGPLELLAERFHMDEGLLQALNRDKALTAGTTITVANVRQAPPKAQVTRIVVERERRSLKAFDRDGKLLGFFPVSLGSDDRPAPSGTLKITRIVHNPAYTYDPRFNFPGVKTDKRLKIAAGPNNPVGAVWMNLNQRTYGIHGTAEPAKVGRVYSHGCVRLTNWDARMLAAMVRKGTVVEFVE
jgi:lipoprotein-anchoring transpeptidase ErfK/SrfK